MSKKDKIFKFGETAIDQFENNTEVKDAALHLYKNDGNGFVLFLEQLFGIGFADDLVDIIEEYAETKKCYDDKDAGLNWFHFKSMCQAHGANDATDCLRRPRTYAGDADEKLSKVFDKLRDVVTSHAITNVEFKIELRTPYTVDTYHSHLAFDILSLVNNLRTFRELLFNAVYVNIKELEHMISSEIEMHGNCDTIQRFTPVIAEQYEEMHTRLTTKTNRNGEYDISPLRNLASSKLSMSIYEDVAMLVGTMFGMITNDGGVPAYSDEWVYVTDIGTAYSSMRPTSVSVTVTTDDGLKTLTYEPEVTAVDETADLRAINALTENNKEEY